MEREQPRPGKLPEDIEPDSSSVLQMNEDGVIGYPSEYGHFDTPEDYMEAVVDILGTSPGYPNPVTCDFCEDEGIPQPHLESEIYLNEYDPGQANWLSDDEVEEFEERGIKVYEVELFVECPRHASEDLENDVSMSYTEYIEATPGALDL